MGVHKNIKSDYFPKQGAMLGVAVQVCFHYNRSVSFLGKCVRDDVEEPHRTIFKLNNGTYVLASECHYEPLWDDLRDNQRGQ